MGSVVDGRLVEWLEAALNTRSVSVLDLMHALRTLEHERAAAHPDAVLCLVRLIDAHMETVASSSPDQCHRLPQLVVDTLEWTVDVLARFDAADESSVTGVLVGLRSLVKSRVVANALRAVGRGASRRATNERARRSTRAAHRTRSRRSHPAQAGARDGRARGVSVDGHRSSAARREIVVEDARLPVAGGARRARVSHERHHRVR